MPFAILPMIGFSTIRSGKLASLAVLSFNPMDLNRGGRK